MGKQHRERFFRQSHISLATSNNPILGRIITLLHLVPAVLCGCSDAEHPAYEEIRREIGIALTKSQDVKGPLDIFVFEDDRMRKLDCYLRLEDFSMWKGGVVTGSGDRIITFITGIQKKKDDWIGITSRAALEKIIVNLEDESPEAVVMSGETGVRGAVDYTGVYGEVRPEANIELSPVSSQICLERLSCDFTGKPYSDKSISNVKVYLTNVNASCGVLASGEIAPTRIINQGRLSEEDLADFKDRSLIYHQVAEPVGKSGKWTPLEFLCYPSSAPEEAPGTPFTRLVIEGKVDGRTFYWPVDINRSQKEGQGIDRGRRYAFDIKITGKGVSDPDTPVSSEYIDINFKIKEWDEKEDYSILF